MVNAKAFCGQTDRQTDGQKVYAEYVTILTINIELELVRECNLTLYQRQNFRLV